MEPPPLCSQTHRGLESTDCYSERAIERAIPHIFDVDRANYMVELTKDRATPSIWHPDETDWELGFIYRLLNYFELISSSYLNAVAERKLLTVLS